MKDDKGGLNKDWKKRIEEIGAEAFEIEEMLRLGFLKKEKLDKINKKGVELNNFTKALEQYSNIQKHLSGIDNKIEKIGTLQEALNTIRSQRIKRVKQKNAEQKIQKETQRKQRVQKNRELRVSFPTFLGRDVSNRLSFSGGDEVKLNKQKLPILRTFIELSSALELQPLNLQWLVYDRGATTVDHYTRFEIAKRLGGTRLISSPKPVLRKTQRWILEFVLRNLPVHQAAMAFRQNLSILDNAKLHSNSKIVIRIDLKDFFPSITFPRVRGFFESLGYNPGISTVMSLLCTDSPKVLLKVQDEINFVSTGPRSLPQGACTSPDLANLIANKLDRRLQNYAAKVGWVFSRYADDLVFSTNKVDMPAHRLVRAVSMIVAAEGFQVNKKKTRVMRQPHRQMVTGLVVNKDVRISRRDIRRFRAFFHRCSTQGLDEVSKELEKDAMTVARGYMAYVHMISPATAQKFYRQHPWIKAQYLTN